MSSPPSPSLSLSPSTGSTAPGASASLLPGASGAVAADPLLIAALPSEVDGLAAQLDPTRDADLATSADLARVATGIASALYIDPSVGDFAYATVVRLRPGGIGDAAYASWRQTFDEGACSQAGGVDGHAQADIGGRPTYIGTCAGGVHTYHTLLGTDLLVSVSAVGERRLGERVLEGLHPLS